MSHPGGPAQRARKTWCSRNPPARGPTCDVKRMSALAGRNRDASSPVPGESRSFAAEDATAAATWWRARSLWPSSTYPIMPPFCIRDAYCPSTKRIIPLPTGFPRWLEHLHRSAGGVRPAAPVGALKRCRTWPVHSANFARLGGRSSESEGRILLWGSGMVPALRGGVSQVPLWELKTHRRDTDKQFVSLRKPLNLSLPEEAPYE